MTATLVQATAESARSRAMSIERQRTFSLTMAVCAANGLAAIIIKSIAAKGVVDAAWSTFDVSALVWISILFGLKYSSVTAAYTRVRPVDVVLCGFCLMLSIVPIGHASWLALTILCIRELTLSDPDSDSRRGARILLAVTVPVFWARLIFSFFAPTLLGIDARITGLILGTPVKGNLVEFFDGSGYFQIYPACSSFGNISLALLGLCTAFHVLGGASRIRCLVLALTLSFSIFIVNIVRLVAIGIFPEHFELIHGSTGSSVAGGLAIGLVAVFCWLGFGKQQQ